MKSVEEFGGFMLWDAGWDDSNQINGKRYSDNLKEFFIQSKSEIIFYFKLCEEMKGWSWSKYYIP